MSNFRVYNHDGKVLPMLEAAKDWLKLMVVQFDAIKIVAAYYEMAAIIKNLHQDYSPSAVRRQDAPLEGFATGCKVHRAQNQ